MKATSEKSGAMYGVVPASKLIGETVVNRQGENVGKIHELVIDAEKNRVPARCSPSATSWTWVTNCSPCLGSLRILRHREQAHPQCGQGEMENATVLDRSGIDFVQKIREEWKPTDDDHAMRNENR